MRIVNSALKRALRARAHALKPVVIVADRGLDDTVVEEARSALEHHELIKVRIRRERAERKALAEALCEATGAALIQSIGQIVCLYRPRPQTNERVATPANRRAGVGKSAPRTRAGTDERRGTPWTSAKERKRSRTAPRRQP